MRLLTMRSTVHLLVADDALMLRRFTTPIHERERKVSQVVRPAMDSTMSTIPQPVLISIAAASTRTAGAALG